MIKRRKKLSVRARIAFFITGAVIILAVAIFAILLSTGTLRFFAAPAGTGASISPPTNSVIPPGSSTLEVKLVINSGATSGIDGFVFDLSFPSQQLSLTDKSQVSFLKKSSCGSCEQAYAIETGKWRIVNAGFTAGTFAANTSTEVVLVKFSISPQATGNIQLQLSGSLREGANVYPVADSVTYSLGGQTQKAAQIVLDATGSTTKKLYLNVNVVPGTETNEITAYKTKLQWQANEIKLVSVTNLTDYSGGYPTDREIEAAKTATAGSVTLRLSGGYLSGKTSTFTAAKLEFDILASAGSVITVEQVSSQTFPITVNGTVPALASALTYQVAGVTTPPTTPPSEVTTGVTETTVAISPSATATIVPKKGDFAHYGTKEECAPRNAGCLIATPDGIVDGADLLYFMQYLYGK